MTITNRRMLNEPDKLSPLRKEALEREAADKAQRIAASHPGEWAFLGLVGMNLQRIGAQQAPKRQTTEVAEQGEDLTNG